jgi:hypothetical protein
MARKRRPTRGAESGDAQTEAPLSVRRVTIRGLDGNAIELNPPANMQTMALSWSHVARNRARWAEDPEGVASIKKRAVDDLQALGLNADQLRDLANLNAIEINIPFEEEKVGWELRILPWEFLLTMAITKDRPGSFAGDRSGSLVIVRRLERMAPANAPKNPPGAAAPAAPQTLALVASLPGDLVKSGYDFGAELALVRSNLGIDAPALEDPTIDELRSHLAQLQPHVVHLTGVDLHQGNRLLGIQEKRDDRYYDGFFFAGEDGSAYSACDQDVADAVNAAESGKPRLACFNFYNSAARIAALTVAGGTRAAIGFQDEVDDLVAEQFFMRFYSAWRVLDWDLLRAFRLAVQGTVDQIGDHLGVVLWSAAPLIDTTVKTSIQADDKRVAESRRETVSLSSPADIAKDLSKTIKPFESANYSLLHNNQPLFQDFLLRNINKDRATLGKIHLQVELNLGENNYPYRSLIELEGGTSRDFTNEIRLPLTSAILRSLRESMRTVMFVKISHDETTVYEQTFPVLLLGRDEWIDQPRLNRFLPSFVLPGDPAVGRIIDGAQRYLIALSDDLSAGFDGYQSVNLQSASPYDTVDAQVRSIWSALSQDFRISYINPPPSFKQSSQRLRSPSDVIDGKRGTCIDLALMLAACVEYTGIYPVFFLAEGHAFPGYWRSEESRQKLMGPDSRFKWGECPWLVDRDPDCGGYDTVVDLVRTGDLAPLETVWLTQHKGFWEACDAGIENLSIPSDFQAMIDIKGARDNQVTPLPLL